MRLQGSDQILILRKRSETIHDLEWPLFLLKYRCQTQHVQKSEPCLAFTLGGGHVTYGETFCVFVQESVGIGGNLRCIHLFGYAVFGSLCFFHLLSISKVLLRISCLHKVRSPHG